MQTIELQAIYSSQKSFYKKAHVTITATERILTSYSTDVAMIRNGKAIVHGTYSVTTLVHIKEFLKQNGFEATSKAQIIRDYSEVIEEPSEAVRCNNCMTVYSSDDELELLEVEGELVKSCRKCKTDAYLMDGVNV